MLVPDLMEVGDCLMGGVGVVARGDCDTNHDTYECSIAE